MTRLAEEHDYYQRPKHLLRELKLNFAGILWTEVAFCEKCHSTERISEATFEKCSNLYLRKHLSLLPENKYVLCLGGTAYQYVSSLPESKKWKVIYVYHPTGARIFANYFKKEKGKKLVEQSLKEKILHDFHKLEAKHQPYICKIAPEGIETL